MSRARRSLPPAYFERLYAENPDPWGFAGSDYERAKYEATLAALPRQRYRRALEVGCSIGVLTAALAGRCADLLAVDVAERALAQARTRCRDLPQVRFARSRLPDDASAGGFDLIVLSEVVYYWDARDVGRMGACLKQALLPGGHLLLVHWLGETDYPLSGDDAVQRLLETVAPFTAGLLASRRDLYRLDLLQRLVREPAA